MSNVRFTDFAQNTSDMMERLKDIGVPAGKKLASFDVTALFTNVPVKGALNAIKRVLDEIDETNLPLPKTHFMKMISLCMEFNCFCFNGTEYLQHSGLAMGSPLSPVGACLYMEDLEQSKFLNIMGADSEWMRYVDDVLVVVPEKLKIKMQGAKCKKVKCKKSKMQSIKRAKIERQS